MDSLEQKQADFLATLGNALSQWNFVESSLFNIFNTVLGTHRNKTSAIFYSQINFRNKLQMVADLMEVTVDKSSCEEWNSLNNRLIKFSKKRNNLAHYEYAFQAEKDVSKPHLILTPSLQPTSNKPANRQHLLSNKKTLYIQDLRTITNSFITLGKDLNDFEKRLSNLDSINKILKDSIEK